MLALAGTVLGLVLLLGFKTQAPTVQADASPPQVAAAPPTGDPAAGAASSETADSSSPAFGPTPIPTRGLDRTGRTTPPALTTAPAPTDRPTARPTPAPTQKPATADITGPVEQTPYGNVQVEAKVQGGRLVDVVALQLPSDRRRSAEISQYVEPILHDEALQAQSAQIDLISGATWTSGGYQASLQAALAQVH